MLRVISDIHEVDHTISKYEAINYLLAFSVLQEVGQTLKCFFLFFCLSIMKANEVVMRKCNAKLPLDLWSVVLHSVVLLIY